MEPFFEAVGRFRYIECVVAVVALALVTCIIQWVIIRQFRKYIRIDSGIELTGADIARSILHSKGINDVQVQMIGGELTDKYSPGKRTVFLSAEVYNGYSVFAMAMAAHKVGHAIQHRGKFFPVKLRSFLMPIATVGSRFSLLIVVIGLIISAFGQDPAGLYVSVAGLVLFFLGVLFTVVMLPAEYNANKKAIEALDGMIGSDSDTMKWTGKVLNAAALTYVALLSDSLIYLFRILATMQGSDKD